MKTGYTDLTIILDRSGSMSHIRKDTIGGINAFIEEQKKASGEATMTLIQFDHAYEENYLRKPITEVVPLTDATYCPRGNTALLDAIGRTINILGTAYAAMDESSRPEKVVLVIQTDGEENASQEFSSSKIKEMIELQRDAYHWEFIFLGANQDAFAIAASMGIPKANAMTFAYDGAGSKDAYLSASAMVAHSRSTGDSLRGFTSADYSNQVR